MVAPTRYFPIRLTLALACLLTTTNPDASAASRGEDPTIVSMRFRDVAAKDAYAALGAQAGVTIRYSWGAPPEDKRVTATLVHEPFWTAMAKIGKAANMQMTYVRREPGREVWLSPHHVMSHNKPVGTSIDGLFIGTLYDNVSQALLRAPVDPTRKHASDLTITLRAEPKIKAMMWHSLEIDDFVDETGRPLVHRVLSKNPGFHDGSATTILRMNERSWPRRIGRMRVRGKVLASLRSELAELKDLTLDSPPGVSAAGFRIGATTAAGERGRLITLNMTRERHVSPDWLRPSSRLGLLEPIVLDPAGRKYILHAYDRDWFGRMCRFEFEAVAPKPRPGEKPYGPPHRLVMEVPTEVVEYDVQLEFSDVNLF
jgi:hypothetical protein